MSNNTSVCRFCLKLVRVANIKLINEVTQKILGLLLIKMDLDVSADPVICKMCSGILHQIYMFKSKCLHSEDIVSTHFEGNLKVNLRDILIEFKNKPNAHTVEDTAICRLCLKIPPNGNYISLNKRSDKVSDCRNIIQNQLPEINLSFTEERIICEECHVLLKNYLFFATNCMDVEQKIKMYCEHQGSNVNEQVDLLCVLQFAENRAKDCDNNFHRDLEVSQGDGSVYVKVEKVEFKKENLSKDNFMDISGTEFYIKEEEIEIKSEDDQIRMEMSESDQLNDSDYIQKSDSPKKKKAVTKITSKGNIHFCTECPYSAKKTSSIKKHFRRHGKIYKCNLCPVTVDNRFALRIHMRSHKGPTNMFTCTECSYEFPNSSSLVQHLLAHKDKSELEMHKCHLCVYENKSKETLRQHYQLHHDQNVKIYKCKECSWTTKYKESIERHEFLHKIRPSDKRPFCCDQCTFSTYLQEYLLHHKRNIHMDRPRVTLQCNQCEFRTKWRTSLNFHKKTHNPTPLNPEVPNKFKCEQCKYSTHRRAYFNSHLLTHIPLGEAVMYYCATCDFKTKYKGSLKDHVQKCLKEKNGRDSRVTLQCNQCDFHTKWRGSLNYHKKAHDPISRRKFKCERCDYSNHRQSSLKQHLVTHMDLGETEVYCCATCDFKSKYKSSLMAHIKCCSKKKHTVSKVQFQCKHCDFRTKRKSTLSMHNKIHDPSKRKFKCKQCEYSTYIRSSLNQHLLTHMTLGETVVYDCVTCNFKTKYKSSLMRHVNNSLCSKKKDDNKN